MFTLLRATIEGFIKHFVMPFRYLRLAIYYSSRALSHPLGVLVIAFLTWRSHATPYGHDMGGFVFTMLGYLALIAAPARFLANLTWAPPAERTPELPKETKWPAPARVALAVPPPAEEASPSEAEMWARLDPLLQRIAKPPGA